MTDTIMKLKVNLYTVLSSMHNCGDAVTVCKTIEELNAFKAECITTEFGERPYDPEDKVMVDLVKDGEIDDAWEQFCNYAESRGDSYQVHHHELTFDVPELTALLGITAEEPQKWVEKCKALVNRLSVLLKDGEDMGDGQEFELENDDAVSELHSVIDDCREIKAMERK